MSNDTYFNKVASQFVDPRLLGLASLDKAYEQWIHGTFYRLNVYFNKAVVIKHVQVGSELKYLPNNSYELFIFFIISERSILFFQVPSHTIPDLWPSVGGVLGLWAGISVISSLEIISLIFSFCHINLIKAFYGRNESNTKVKDLGDEGSKT